MNTLFYTFTIGSLLAIIFIFLIYLLKKVAQTQLQQIFSVNMILIITTSIFTLFQMQLSSVLNIKPIYFAYFYYIGIVFFPVSLYFTVKIFQNIKIEFKPIDLLLFIIPMLSLLGLWTNQRFHLFFKEYDIVLNNCKFGPLFIINEIYAYVLYLISIINLIRFLNKNYGYLKSNLNLFLAGIIFPFILNLLCTLKIVEFTIYITPISASISIICFALAIFKFKLVDTLPIALSKIVNKISDGYIVIDEKNFITNYNLTFLKIFELNEKDLIISTHIFDLLKNKNLKGLTESTVINAINASKKSNEILSIEKDFKKINKFLKLEFHNLKSENVFIGTLILVKDITEHQKDIETIKLNQNMLIEKERLASLGEMISGVAHNLKTPLFSISGATEGLNDLINEYETSIDDKTVTIEDHKEIAKDMKTWIEKMKEYTSYMSDVITAIRGQATSFTENTMETFTIEEVLKRVKILMKHELQQSLVTLNINNMTNDIRIQGNMNILIQVINNLISNGIQSYQGEPNKNIDLEVTNKKNRLLIKITDYGMGIPEELKDKLFKEIVTTKGNNGTGLGLFISYSNIKNRISSETFHTLLKLEKEHLLKYYFQF